VSHEHTFAANTGSDDWNREAGDPQAVFDSMYNRGIRHFAISNYHPPKPTYPLEEHFKSVPDDAIGCPNAEHSGSGVHYCAIGSEARTKNRGYDRSWEELNDELLDALTYDGGGGIVINHPRRSDLSFETLTERLDYDERVLGIGAWNHRGVVLPKYRSRGNALSTWDELLATGRLVYGFFNPDYHGPWGRPRAGYLPRGRNVLLVPEPTEDAALKAYRRGRFYGALDGSGLRFERIEAREGQIAVETNRADVIEFVTAGRVVSSVFDAAAGYEFDGPETYVRVQAADDTGERIFSQPIVYRPAGAESESD
jgi:hypothetical protein